MAKSDLYDRKYEATLKEGQVVRFIKESPVANIGDKAIVQVPDKKEFYKTKLGLFDEFGQLSGKTQEIFNSFVKDYVEVIEEGQVEEAFLKEEEAPVIKIEYVTEKEIEDKIKNLPDYKLETIKTLSMNEIKVLISLHSGFHPKYITDVDVVHWLEGSDVYEIDFNVIGFPSEICMLIYEEGCYDLDFK